MGIVLLAAQAGTRADTSRSSLRLSHSAPHTSRHPVHILLLGGPSYGSTTGEDPLSPQEVWQQPSEIETDGSGLQPPGAFAGSWEVSRPLVHTRLPNLLTLSLHARG